MNAREQFFADGYRARTGLDLIHHPAVFRIDIRGHRFSYEPDFQCVATATYFEVVGTRQAAYLGQWKWEAFRQSLAVTHPGFNFKVVRPDGSDYLRGPDKGGHGFERATRHTATWDHREQVAKTLRDGFRAGLFTTTDVARYAGLKTPTVWYIATGKVQRPGYRTIRKIQAFLESHAAAAPTGAISA